MILKYRGNQMDWVLEEADVISYTTMSIEDVRSRIKKADEYKNATTSDEANRFIADGITEFIRNETGCPEDITFHGIIDFEGGKNFIVAALDNTRTRVFDYSATVYVLNSSGKTIQKL